MSDSNNSKTVQVLREEYYFLDVYISKLERENQDLVKRHIELENSLIELRKYHKEFEQCAATVYDPNKPTYKELETKLALAENSKQAEIDELYETKIIPLREKMQQLEGQLISEEVKRKKDIDELWETRIIPLQNQVKDRTIQLDSAYQKEVSHRQRIESLEKTIENLGMLINYAVGYISSCEQFRDKYPNDVKNWLFEGLK